MHANILVVGLAEKSAAELSFTLKQLGHTVMSEPFLSVALCLDAIDRYAADLVFCAADPAAYEEVLSSLRRSGREVPVVVVSNLPEVEKWLDALDAGAFDYCAPPFELRLLRSLVDNALTYRRPLTVAS